jgi:hypothetical protein
LRVEDIMKLLDGVDLEVAVGGGGEAEGVGYPVSGLTFFRHRYGDD